jgi:hypothetical protein
MTPMKGKARTIVNFALILLAICLAFGADGKPAWSGEADAAPRRDDTPVFVRGIKYHNQNEKGQSSWCVIYSTAMFLSGYGIEETPEVIARQLNMPTRESPYFSWKSTFSDDGSLEKYLKNHHRLAVRKKIFVTLRPPVVDWIKKNLSRGRPVIAIYGQWDGHAVVLVGFDRQYLYLNDPSGALFHHATRVLKKDMTPSRWLNENRTSPLEGAGIPWEDFAAFIRERNAWGYLVTADGRIR